MSHKIKQAQVLLEKQKGHPIKTQRLRNYSVIHASPKKTGRHKSIHSKNETVGEIQEGFVLVLE